MCRPTVLVTVFRVDPSICVGVFVPFTRGDRVEELILHGKRAYMKCFIAHPEDIVHLKKHSVFRKRHTESSPMYTKSKCNGYMRSCIHPTCAACFQTQHVNNLKPSVAVTDLCGSELP